MAWLHRLRTYAGEFSQLLFMRLYAAGMTFVLTLVLGRLLGPAEYGAYAFALSVLGIGLLFATFGFHHFVIRTLPRLLVEDTQSEAVGVIVFGGVVVTLLSGMTAVLAFWNADRFAEAESLQGAVAVAALLLVPRALALFRMGTLQGLGHPIASQMPDRLIEPTLIFLGVGLLALMGGPMGAETVLYVTLGAIVLSFLAGTPSLVSALRALWTAPAFEHVGLWTVGALKSSLVFAAGTVLGATDLILLGRLSSPEETGIYGVAIKFFLLMGLPFHAGAVFLSERATRAHATGDRDGLERIAERAALRTMLASLALVLPCTAVAFFVAEIFGAGFVPAGTVILVLVWARMGLSLFGDPSTLLGATQHVGRVSIVISLAALLNIALNLVMIPPLGAIGAALATVTSYGFLTVVLAWNVRRVLGIRVFYAMRLFSRGPTGDRG